jgi:hypothetical protein
MSDVANLLTSIENKLSKVLERQLELDGELKLGKKEIEELIQITNQQKKTIASLEEKIRLIKLTKTIENKDGAQEAKIKINELVREIDKCIGLLNT